MMETSVQVLHFSFFLPFILKVFSSCFVLILTHSRSCWVVCQGIVECHILGWHSCLDTAEVQTLARAACSEETGTGSQGLSTHLLPEPVRHPSFINSADAKSSSCHTGDILFCDCCTLLGSCPKSACLAVVVFSPFSV